MAKRRNIPKSLRKQIRSANQQSGDSGKVKINKKSLRQTKNSAATFDDRPKFTWSYDVGDLVKIKSSGNVCIIVKIADTGYKSTHKRDYKSYHIFPQCGYAGGINGKHLELL
jgi:hypothetical protein